MKNIRIENLKVDFKTQAGLVHAVSNLNINITPGIVTAIVGESGSGKSVMANAILDMLPPYAKTYGKIIYDNYNIIKERKKIKGFYGKEFGLIPQYPGEALNPSKNIFSQFKILKTRKESNLEIKEKAIKLLSYMGFPNSNNILKMYPFELSGGMQQRIICAASLFTNPNWIIADEPTKGLDEDVKWSVIKNLQRVREYNNSCMLIITHDLEIAKNFSDKQAIMYGGTVVEYGCDVLKNPLHPYTKAFIKSLPENGFNILNGSPPAPFEEINHCVFYSRCKDRMPICRDQNPNYIKINENKVRCFLYD